MDSSAFALRGEMYSYSSREVDENGNDLNPLVTVANPLVSGPWILTVRYAPDEDGGALRLDVNGFTRIEALGHQFSGGITTINLGATDWDDRLSPADPSVILSGGDALAQTLGTVCAMGDAVSAEQQALLEEYLSDYYGWGDRSAPFVRLASPGDNTHYENQIPDVAMQVEILSQDAPIEKVEYIWVDRDQVLGETTEAPYLMVWENVMPGAYRVQARVTDMAGRVGVSRAHVFIVTLEGFGVTSTGWVSGGVGLGVPGSSGYSPDGNSISNPNQLTDIDSDGDGLTNAQEAELGIDSEKEDSDGDGRLDVDDMVPYDPDITLVKTTVPNYAVIDLGEFIPMDINEVGTILGCTVTGEGDDLLTTYYLWHQGAWEFYEIGNDDPDEDGIFEIKLAEEVPVAFGRWRTNSGDDGGDDLCDFSTSSPPANEGAFVYHAETGYKDLEWIKGGTSTSSNIPLRVEKIGEDYKIIGEGRANKTAQEALRTAPEGVEVCYPPGRALYGDLTWGSNGSGSGIWSTSRKGQVLTLEDTGPEWYSDYGWDYNAECGCWEFVTFAGSSLEETDEECSKVVYRIKGGEYPLTYQTDYVSLAAWGNDPSAPYGKDAKLSRTYKFYQHTREGYVGGWQPSEDELLSDLKLVEDLELEPDAPVTDLVFGSSRDWERGYNTQYVCDFQTYADGHWHDERAVLWFGSPDDDNASEIAYLYDGPPRSNGSPSETSPKLDRTQALGPAWAVMDGLRVAHPQGLWANGKVHPWEELTGGREVEEWIDGNKSGLLVVQLETENGGPDQTIDAAPALLLPTEIVQPKLDIEGLPAGELNSVSEVRFCRWRTAFEGGNFDSNFIENDHDRFIVRIDGSISQEVEIDAKLSTFTKDREVVDSDTTFTLRKKANGFFESEPMILVADKYDAGFNPDAEFLRGDNNQHGDKTHQGTLGGVMRITVPDLGDAEAEVAIMKPKGLLEVRMLGIVPQAVLGDEWTGELEWTMEVTKEVYAQFGIEIKVRPGARPTDSTLDGYFSDNNVVIPTYGYAVEPDYIIAKFSRQYSTPKYPTLFFLPTTLSDSEDDGYKDGSAYSNDFKNRGHGFVSLLTMNPLVAPHELGHLLMLGHVPESVKTNLMNEGPLVHEFNFEIDAKRLSIQQEKKILKSEYLQPIE